VGLGPTTLVRLEKDSVTIRDTGTDTKGPAEYTLPTDAKTSVRVVEVTEKRTKDGKTAEGGFLREGSLADLKVGQAIQVNGVGSYAAEIRVMPPPPPAVGQADKKADQKGEGNKQGEGNKRADKK
jgi:hypothetical protein